MIAAEEGPAAVVAASVESGAKPTSSHFSFFASGGRIKNCGTLNMEAPPPLVHHRALSEGPL